ncbi:MAG: hypothetical protein KJO33_10000 [Gammaproteobacteria bacterium]|nr:hypothetical protein [Gammaproteobacteria bacterium]
MKTKSLSVAASVLLLALSPALMAQPARISEWVENAPASDNTKIALGYPVPIPVDTPLPFAGFRTYAGLHARHQDLAATTDRVHAMEIGRTRNDRPIWLYQLGDANRETVRGLPEQAMLTNGGIHAREWQSPEVATGIIELLALGPDDDYLLDYLRDNANILVLPVLNVDGFLQTQRFPSRNWMGTDPQDPEGSPRDGRMRRKNMLGPDEDLLTQGDHLLGVDLNRNNPPYWAANPSRSSPDSQSIVHHGASAHSEPETQALDAAAQMGPADQLSMYTDMHSFSQVHFWSRNHQERLARLTEDLLRTFSGHHRAFEAGKNYAYSNWQSVPPNQGIGLTDEYFTHVYRVPSWTLEIEPSNGAAYHAPLPGQGADYGGLGRNGHDGFILPDSEVERVRTELAQTFAIAYYQQSGPPSITTLRIFDEVTEAMVFEAEWDTVDTQTRELHRFQAQPLQLGRSYRAWVAWNKPMRWRTGGAVSTLPGQEFFTLTFNRSVMIGDRILNAVLGDPDWLEQPGGAPEGFQRYRDDAASFELVPLDNETNVELLQGTAEATIELDTYDMTGLRGDADPSTAAHWDNGAWASYENSNGFEGNDTGGVDATIAFEVTSESLDEPFVIIPDMSAMFYDTSRNGEGFMLEVISDTRAIMYWFTYDTEGNQDWYFGDGEIRGNRILFPEVLRVSGGIFGPGFDPDQVERTPVGSADFAFADCDSGVMSWVIDRDGGPLRTGRMELSRLTRVMGIPCAAIGAPVFETARESGSWYDPQRSGEGFTIEVMFNNEVLAFWFSYDTEGNRRWFFGTGIFEGDRIVFPEMYTTLGGIFGDGFNMDDVEVNSWGSMEMELNCTTGSVSFEPTEEGFPSGSYELARLTILQGFSCPDP